MFSIHSLGFSSSSFSNPSGNGPSGPASFDVTIGLGTATQPFNSPITQFSANEGADFETVFSGTVNTTLTGTGVFDLVFPTLPFTYDPSQGALLLDIVVNTLPQTSSAVVGFLADNNGQSFHRVYAFKGTVYTDQAGLVTDFNGDGTPGTNPVPEASTTTSLGLLLALGGVVIAAKRKKSVA